MKYFSAYIFVTALVFTLSIPSISTAQSNLDTKTQIIVACQQLVYDYAYYRDQSDAENWAGVFAEDGVFVHDEVHEGREALKKHVTDSLDGIPRRHIMSTVKITPIDSNTATGISYAMVLGGEKPEISGTETPLTGIRTVVEYHDQFKLTDEGWKIARREAKTIFTPPK